MKSNADSAGAIHRPDAAPSRRDPRGSTAQPPCAARVLAWLAAGLSAAMAATPAAAAPAASAGAADVSTAAPPHAPAPVRRATRTPADAAGRVAVWVDLDLPELASVPRGRRAERDALRLQIDAQQDAVMARLRALGATEQARVRWVRNALAVRLPAAQFDAARRIPGVRGVRPVRNIDRDPLVQGN